MKNFVCSFLISAIAASSYGQIPTGYMRGSYDPWGILPNPMLKLERSIDDREYDKKFEHSADWLLNKFQESGNIDYGHGYIWLCRKYKDLDRLQMVLIRSYDKADLDGRAAELRFDRLPIQERILAQSAMAAMRELGEHPSSSKNPKCRIGAHYLLDFTDKNMAAQTPEEAVVQTFAAYGLGYTENTHVLVRRYLQKWPTSELLIATGARCFMFGTDRSDISIATVKDLTKKLQGSDSPGIRYLLGVSYKWSGEDYLASAYLKKFLSSSVQNRVMRRAAEERLSLTQSGA